jgi:hypothetical protein
MNHKAEATCHNGHKVELGVCTETKKSFFGGEKECGSKGYIELSANEIQCIGCKAIYTYKICPICKVQIPILEFKKKSLFSKLG